MRKTLLLFPIVAALIAGCSNEVPAIDNDDNGNGETNFLTVNLVSTPSNGTRAEGDQNPGEYEDGDKTENSVKGIRFYFFDEDGNPAAVKSNGNNYVDVNKITDAGQDKPNVEKKIQATIVISTKDGDKLPTKIVAVLNPNTGLPTDKNLSQLRDVKENYVTTRGEGNGFVMINSVFKYGEKEISATAVTEANYAKTEAQALNNPVTIYVERPVAKVRVQFHKDLGYDSTTKRIALKELDEENSTATNKVYKNLLIDGKQVYLEVSGWNVTAETNEGYLSKHIDVNWKKADIFGTEDWNWEPYFRSYWAKNTDTAEQSWHSYNDIMKQGGKGFDGSLGNSIYLNENAPQQSATATSAGANVEKFSKVIIAGKLVYQDGTAVEVVKYAGLTMVGETSIKNLLLEQLKTSMIYKVTKDGDKTTYSELTAADVEFKTAIKSNINGVTGSESTTGRYLVYLQLTDEAAKHTWSKSKAEDQDVTKTYFDSTAAVNDYLAKENGSAQIYKGGLTYYYFPIRHLGDAGKIGYYGVVRNHIYDCNISAIHGLGTPVYDPEEVIYPEKPEGEDTFIAAAINILSWRVVPNNITLEW